MAEKVFPGPAWEPMEFLLDLSLFADLKEKEKFKKNLKRYRGPMWLRWFQKDDVICRMGEEASTAFYILKVQDVEKLQQAGPAKARQRLQEIPEEMKQVEDQIRDGEIKVRELGEPLEEPQRKQLEKLQDAINELQAKSEALQDERDGWSRFINVLERPPSMTEAASPAVIVNLPAPDSPGDRHSWWSRLYQKWAPRVLSENQDPKYLPADGPTALNTQTRQALMHEGDLFGEMACLNRAPRSATVTAARDCYVLEMLSNVLVELDADVSYQKKRKEIYKERVLELHLRDLAMFRDLSNDQFAQIYKEVRDDVELVSSKAGQIICDEHERSDCVYLIRAGLVQVKKNVSSLLSVADVTDWEKLWSELRSTSGLASTVASALSETTRIILETKDDPKKLTPNEQSEIVHDLNQLIKNAKLKDIQDIGKSSASSVENLTAAKTKELLKTEDGKTSQKSSMGPDPKKEAARIIAEVVKSTAVRPLEVVGRDQMPQNLVLEQRREQRFLLDAIFSGCIRPLPRFPDPPLVLSYLSQGEFIGEMGVYRRLPRSATCIAFGQPDRAVEKEVEVLREDVELVRIPDHLFLRLLETFPILRSQVEKEIARREEQSQERAQQSCSQVDATGMLSQDAERLGLMQGRQLMLIDMERCILCGECVRACENSHADQKTRLFLVGNRFDKYMVPITCRSCLDPVCMIGCPVRSIQRGNNGEIQIKDWCIGCELCAKSCPYDAIKMHSREVTNPQLIQKPFVAVVCDLCSSLPDRQPRCVYACPHEAALRFDARSGLPID
jgi:Fe-S-cluster-containing hydrogenase component 2/CRP-like cAMP-binding protein